MHMDARRENVWLRRRPERRCEPGKRFPQVLISMTIFTKYVGTKRHMCRERTPSDYEYVTNPSRNFSNLAKHSYGELRLYECSRNAGLLLVSQRFLQEKPRGGSRGAVTRILSGR